MKISREELLKMHETKVICSLFDSLYPRRVQDRHKDIAATIFIDKDDSIYFFQDGWDGSGPASAAKKYGYKYAYSIDMRNNNYTIHEIIEPGLTDEQKSKAESKPLPTNYVTKKSTFLKMHGEDVFLESEGKRILGKLSVEKSTLDIYFCCDDSFLNGLRANNMLSYIYSTLLPFSTMEVLSPRYKIRKPSWAEITASSFRSESNKQEPPIQQMPSVSSKSDKCYLVNRTDFLNTNRKPVTLEYGLDTKGLVNIQGEDIFFCSDNSSLLNSGQTTSKYKYSYLLCFKETGELISDEYKFYRRVKPSSSKKPNIQSVPKMASFGNPHQHLPLTPIVDDTRDLLQVSCGLSNPPDKIYKLGSTTIDTKDRLLIGSSKDNGVATLPVNYSGVDKAGEGSDFSSHAFGCITTGTAKVDSLTGSMVHIKNPSYNPSKGLRLDIDQLNYGSLAEAFSEDHDESIRLNKDKQLLF